MVSAGGVSLLCGISADLVPLVAMAAPVSLFKCTLRGTTVIGGLWFSFDACDDCLVIVG